MSSRAPLCHPGQPQACQAVRPTRPQGPGCGCHSCGIGSARRLALEPPLPCHPEHPFVIQAPKCHPGVPPAVSSWKTPGPKFMEVSSPGGYPHRPPGNGDEDAGWRLPASLPNWPPTAMGVEGSGHGESGVSVMSANVDTSSAGPLRMTVFFVLNDLPILCRRGRGK